jgi:hypothetical protein
MGARRKMSGDGFATIRPATTGVALLDDHGAAVRAWKTTLYAILGACIAGLVVILVLMLPAVYNGFGMVILVATFGVFALLLLALAFALAYVSVLTAQRNELADALTRAGHPGVDARRLLAGRPAPSPQNIELRLRRERDGGGRRWLLVDGYSYPAA